LLLRRDVLLDILQEERRTIDADVVVVARSPSIATPVVDRFVYDCQDNDDDDDDDDDDNTTPTTTNDNDDDIWHCKAECVYEPECDVLLSLRRRSKKQGNHDFYHLYFC
jgi:hypothetical protein